jgi:hypothetical protein
VTLRAMLVTLDVAHNLHWKERFTSSFSFLLLPYLCLHTVGLVRMEVVWVCFDVLFFISEFHFLFVLIFILACLYIFVLLVFSFKCLFQCLFVCLFISFVFPFSIYLLFMLYDYFIIFSLNVYLALKRDYHILFVYWLIVYVVFLKISRNYLCII